MAKRISFFNIASSNSLLYLNPALLQNLAGAAVEELVDADIKIYDGAAGDSYLQATERLDRDDIAVICMMSDANLDQFLKCAGQYGLKADIAIVLVGDLVTDGDALAVVSRISSALPENPAFAFVGREIERFIQLLRDVSSHSSTPDLPNAVSLHFAGTASQWPTLPATTETYSPLFSTTIRRAIQERGISVLTEGLTRGCEHHCTYCHLNFNKQTRGLVQDLSGHAAKRIIHTAEQIPRNSFLFFTDENFFGGKGTASEERLGKIVALSSNLIDSGFSRGLAVDTRIDSLYNPADGSEQRELRRQAWQSFKTAGLKYAYLGVESFSESQLRRYAKTAEYPAIIPGIEEARRLGIAFTLGMIIMDPLVAPAEVQETLAFIRERNLYSNVASLMKPLRLGMKSPYASWAKGRLSTSTWNMFPGGIDIFRDPLMLEIWPVVHRIHQIFSGSGYRNSDVALFDSVFPVSGTATSPRIPALVSRMECDVLGALLAAGSTRQSRQVALQTVERTVRDCWDWIASQPLEPPGSLTAKVMRYYQTVFGAIRTIIEQPRWLADASLPGELT
jgi:hypothetical protein